MYLVQSPLSLPAPMDSAGSCGCGCQSKKQLGFVRVDEESSSSSWLWWLAAAAGVYGVYRWQRDVRPAYRRVQSRRKRQAALHEMTADIRASKKRLAELR